MNRNDIPPPAFRPLPRDLLMALALLTRLPLPQLRFDSDAPRPAAFAAWAYPLVGMVVAGLSGLSAGMAVGLGLPVSVAAVFVVLAGILCTGAMHEDGLADCADGFWGGWTGERRLAIMKDSQIGTYGVIALTMSLGLRWLAVSALLTSGVLLTALLAAAVVSRASMVGVMYALPHARNSGLSRQTGKPPRAAVMIAGAIAFTALLFVIPAPAFLSILMTAAALFGCATLAKAKIGGQTGDVLGATQQITEIGILLACLTTLS